MACGISVQFQDITTEFGLPVYHSALSWGATAALPVPREPTLMDSGRPWRRLPDALAVFNVSKHAALAFRPRPCGTAQVRFLEDLPDYSLASPADNCRLLEAVLADHGRNPLYVDITKGF